MGHNLAYWKERAVDLRNVLAICHESASYRHMLRKSYRYATNKVARIEQQYGIHNPRYEQSVLIRSLGL